MVTVRLSVADAVVEVVPAALMANIAGEVGRVLLGFAAAAVRVKLAVPSSPVTVTVATPALTVTPEPAVQAAVVPVGSP